MAARILETRGWCRGIRQLAALTVISTAALIESAHGAEPAARSPFVVAFSPNGNFLAVSDRTADVIELINPREDRLVAEIAVQDEPTGLAWLDDGRVLVAEFGTGTVAEVDVAKGSVLRRLEVGPHPKGLAVAGKGSQLLVANSTIHGVAVLEIGSGRLIKRIDVPREPFAIAVSSDQTKAVVTNLLPKGQATMPDYAAEVSIIDLAQLAVTTSVRLPAGSSTVRDVVLSDDGKWAYVAHMVGRTNLPATQLERGWVNTNALSIIDLQAGALYATVLLDHPMEGSANPWGVAISRDGRVLWVSISGVHWLARIDLETLHRFMAGGLPDDHRLAKPQSSTPGAESIWLRIKRDGGHRGELVNDLAALHGAGLIERIDLPVRGPRGVALSPDGQTVAVAGYYSGAVALVDAAAGKPRAVPLGPTAAPDEARTGEMIFHDATYCFQHWLSCSTCHPRDGRVDALNWDLPNDGLGTPKNVKSLLGAHLTPPTTWQGVRPSMEVSVERGFYFQMRQPEPAEVEAVRAYLRSLKPRPSPHLAADGQLTAAAARGQELFNSAEVGCANCHRGPQLTDQEMHDVGTRGELDQTDKFDTPSLIELFATPPYLHNGSAATLRELIERNRDDQHGTTSQLSPQQIDDLVAYLLSL
jgi:DNA-binding beta-propeller fold protein YncE